MHLGKFLRNLFTKKQIIQRAECSIFFYLIDRHLLSVYRQFDKAAPAIKLVGADFADILGTAVWTFHHHIITYPLTEFTVFSSRCSLFGGTMIAFSPLVIPGAKGSTFRPSIRSEKNPSLTSIPVIVFPNSWSK